jgi:hypothetical protein
MADDGQLSPAEQKLLEASRTGSFAVFEPNDEVRIRASFIGELLAGAHSGNVHFRGVQILGAIIDGPLDLRFAKVERPIDFRLCRFTGTVDFDGARMRMLALLGCELPMLSACGSATESLFSLSAYEGCPTRISDGLHLIGARIGGDFEASKLELHSFEGQLAFEAQSLDVGGTIQLGSARIEGGITFVCAKVRGNLDLGGARIAAGAPAESADGFALALDRAEIGGSLFLNGSVVNGSLRMPRAKIAVRLDA